jgi:predicted Holliday junction resolvase-like endonuclease
MWRNRIVNKGTASGKRNVANKKETGKRRDRIRRSKERNKGRIAEEMENYGKTWRQKR